MNFISTRGQGGYVTASEAIIKGLADDGGLYVPESFPNLYNNLKEKTNLSYEDLAFEIIKEFFDDISREDLKEAIDTAYKGRFNVVEDKNFLELYHGPTSAFKDAALLFLPQIMKKAKKKQKVNNEIVILTATSGDTGKAALEGFSDVEGFKVVVYYPQNGVSEIQRKQMITQKGNNVKVVGIDGNFDNAQTGVKEIFADKELKKELENWGVQLSSANSINIGRLVPQIVYYFYGYFNLVNKQKINIGDKINVVVPTGNFGNILAAYYGKKMGLPINKLICASNENNVLADFFKTGAYDKRRELKQTESPSMDILVSSNLERLLFEGNNRDSKIINKLMSDLNNKGIYMISEQCREFFNEFYGEYAEIDEVYKAIKDVYEKENYLMDTHTAVGYVVLKKYQENTGDLTPYLIVSTASPYKFPRSICNAIGIEVDNKNDFEVLETLNKITKKDIPENLKNLAEAQVLHNNTCDKEEMKKELLGFLKVKSNV